MTLGTRVSMTPARRDTASIFRIAIVGDYQQGHETHDAIAASVGHHLADKTSFDLSWVPTDSLGAPGPNALDGVDGIWIAPGSPYRSLTGTLAAIGTARRGDIPLLGTCGGFQHVVIEYAREVLGFVDAGHAEYDPYASRLFVTPLSCSLVGTTMSVHLEPGSQAARAYGTTDALERYYCNFGLNPLYEDALVAGGLAVTGRDGDGEARVVELPNHQFFVATLFVPQTRSSADAAHPLIGAFIAAVQAHAVRRATES
jgi:CTP synthase (UTP-ammonia lyase)